MDLHSVRDPDPVIPVCLYRRAFDTSVGVHEPADPSVDHHLFWIGCI
jgi:hypothetical protein